jgi:hypothetical protein
VLQKEREKALLRGQLEKLNNSQAVASFASDKDARFGAKSKFWFGYKKHVFVDK